MCLDVNRVYNNQSDMKKSNGNAFATRKSVTDTDLQIKCLCGGSLIAERPVFDPKNDAIYVAWSDKIRMFSIETGEVIRDLDGNKDGDIVGLSIDAENKKTLIACTANGTVLTWKLDSHLILNKLKLILSPSPTVTSFIPTWIDGESFAIVSYKDDNQLHQVALVELKKGKIAQHYQIPFLNEKNELKVRIADGNAGSNYFVAVQKQTLYVIDKTSSKFIKHDNGIAINVVACHPEHELIATGDVLGKIRLWRNIFSPTPVKAELHWHHMIVLSLAFSQSGTILYSGGVECVLVKWDIREKAIEKDFLPRLTGSIKQISVDSSSDKITVSTDDNAIQVINSNLKQLRSIQDFTQASRYDLGHSEPFPAGIRVNPKTHQLVTNGRIGHLQFFSTRNMKLLFNVDISMRNVIPRTKKLNIFSTEVTHSAFSPNWMATVECWNDRVNSPESRLKFWQFQENKQTYKLNTQIEEAHQKEILCVEFCGDTLCATAGRDNVIKIWSLEKTGSRNVWLCIEELKYKNLPVRHLEFSQDNSLLAAGFGNMLCVWDTVSFKLKCALSAPASNDGSVNRVVLKLPSKKSKESVDKALEKRRKILEMMRSVIDGSGSEQLVKNLTMERKQRSYKQKEVGKEKWKGLSKGEKEMIFKRVLALPDLSFNQKIQVLHKLHIYYKISNRVEEEVVEFITRTAHDTLELFKGLQRNINHVRTHERYKTIWRFKTWQALSSKRSRRMVTVKKLLTHKVSEQVAEIKKLQEESSEKYLPIKNLTHISNVTFCTEELSHLVLVSTPDRLLIWNLLTLKLQGSFKIHTKFITRDPLTNLVAIFTKYNELFVIHPSPAMTIHNQKNIPDIYGAVWVQRETPKAQSMTVNWQATSQLLFLNKKQEICTFRMPSDDDFCNVAPFIEFSNGFSTNTPFAAMIAKKVTDETTKDSSGVTRRIGVSGTGAVKDIINLSSHAMPPVRLLSKEFIGSMLSSRKVEKAQRKDISEVAETMEISDDEDAGEKTKILRRKAIENEEKAIKAKSHAKKEAVGDIDRKMKSLKLETIEGFEI